MTNKSASIGLILALIVGVAIGLLYAPQSGQKTRKLLKKQGKEAQKRVTQAAKKAKKTIAG